MEIQIKNWFDEELDIYTLDGVSDSLDDDAISPFEEGFMLGYLAA